MNQFRKRLTLGIILGSMALILLLWPQFAVILGNPRDSSANAQTGACTQLSDPKNIPSAVKIDFDTLPDGTVIGDTYRPSFGVRFEDSPTAQAVIYGKTPANAHSSPNVAVNAAGAQTTTPMTILFDLPKSHVGFWIGNGAEQDVALMTAYGPNGILCEVRSPVPGAHTTFIGLNSLDVGIVKVTLNYVNSPSAELIDDLYFSPASGLLPTRTPAPTWTSVPTLVPTSGPTPTATPVLPVFAYHPEIIAKEFTLSLLPDFSIHGIEITQGIQCFDTSKGLTGCVNNSVPVVAKKDTTARIYLKANNAFSVYNNIPVRLHIFANGVEYIANTNGKTTTAIDQSKTDSGDIYFNVNFTNAINVSFYAEVDPNNLYTETNELNNRFPAVGTITLNFAPSRTMKVVGQRLRYHPSGYSGSQYAGGWAVNGGAADWYEQLLPIRNNGIAYSVKSGYLDWTTSLGSGDGQHALIQNLNFMWMLENLFFWMNGSFTGARHVYGWAPSAGYSGGHADMPIYPHAGGLGVVGIGSDAAGTSTDNPGSGALIFGHELTHDYNIYHTNTADACGSNDSNSNFPYASSSIQEFGFNPLTGKIYNPNNTHDLMSYCPSGGSKQGWISPFIWTTMDTNLQLSALLPSYAPGEAPAYTLHLTAAAESLQVNATIFNPANKPTIPGQFGSMYKTQGGIADYPVAPNSLYWVELRDSGGGLLDKYQFDVNFESEYDAHGGTPETPTNGVAPNVAPPFPPDPTNQIDVSFIIPWNPLAVSVALVFNGQDLDLMSISPNAPQVMITAPSGPEDWLEGSVHDLTWQAIDLDGDPLSYSVFYSYDAGLNWELLVSDLTSPTLQIDSDSMAGGSDVRFRVVATDGLNTGLDETDATITIPNKLPTATILTPTNNQLFQPGDLVVLQGIGVDLEDGTLPDEGLTWSSDKQGSLGSGPSVPLVSLMKGKHEITLTAAEFTQHDIQLNPDHLHWLPGVPAGDTQVVGFVLSTNMPVSFGTGMFVD